MSEEKINFEEFDWVEVEYMNCDCCKKFNQCVNTNCNWVFEECLNVSCAIKLNVCIVCAYSGHWLCKKHQRAYITQLERTKNIKDDIYCEYTGYNIFDSPVYYMFDPPRPTKIIYCQNCDIDYRICDIHTKDFYKYCRECYEEIILKNIRNNFK